MSTNIRDMEQSKDIVRPWKRAFFTIWSGQAISLVGSGLVQFALVWWLTVETGSATVLALGTLMGVLPQILIAPWAGAYVDRWDRKRTMIVADTLTAITASLLILAFAIGSEQVWMVLLIMFVRAALAGFHWPAMQAATSMMVPEQHLARVSGMNQAMYGLVNVIAAPAGAVLIAFMPMWGVLSVDVVTASVAILPLLFIHVPSPKRDVKGKPSIFGDIKEGLAFLKGWRGAMITILLFMIANLLLSPAFSLLPLLIIDHFGKGAVEYALIESLAGIGMLAGGVALGIWGGFQKKIVTMLSFTVFLSVGIIAIGFTPSDMLLAAYLFSLVIGFSLSLLNGSMMAMMQRSVPFAMQGRVFALISAGATAMMPIGLLLAGPVADAIGVQSWFIIAGVPMLILSICYFFIPSVMSLESNTVGNVAVDKVAVPDE
ncbi:MAG: MFS transporter [Methanomassiliicoccales archaeon]|nr:MFS transporter [Methanomassiliicoccales archaeon]